MPIRSQSIVGDYFFIDLSNMKSTRLAQTSRRDIVIGSNQAQIASWEIEEMKQVAWRPGTRSAAFEWTVNDKRNTPTEASKKGKHRGCGKPCTKSSTKQTPQPSWVNHGTPETYY